MLVFIFNRILCFAGLPSDGQNNWNGVELAENITGIGLYGFFMAASCGLLQQHRVAHLLTLRRVWVPVVVFAIGPIFSAVGDSDAGWSNLSGDAEELGTDALVLTAVIGVCVVVAVAWHIYYAYAVKGTQHCLTYVAARVGIGLVYLGAGIAASEPLNLSAQPSTQELTQYPVNSSSCSMYA